MGGNSRFMFPSSFGDSDLVVSISLLVMEGGGEGEEWLDGGVESGDVPSPESRRLGRFVLEALFVRRLGMTNTSSAVSACVSDPSEFSMLAFFLLRDTSLFFVLSACTDVTGGFFSLIIYD